MFESLVDLEFFLMLNNVKFDFLTLSISLLAFSQFCILSRALFITFSSCFGFLFE